MSSPVVKPRPTLTQLCRDYQPAPLKSSQGAAGGCDVVPAVLPAWRPDTTASLQGVLAMHGMGGRPHGLRPQSAPSWEPGAALPCPALPAPARPGRPPSTRQPVDGLGERGTVSQDLGCHIQRAVSAGGAYQLSGNRAAAATPLLKRALKPSAEHVPCSPPRKWSSRCVICAAGQGQEAAAMLMQMPQIGAPLGHPLAATGQLRL